MDQRSKMSKNAVGMARSIGVMGEGASRTGLGPSVAAKLVNLARKPLGLAEKFMDTGLPVARWRTDCV